MFIGKDSFSTHSHRINVEGMRYYKNDWSFSLSHSGNNQIYSQTLNCMGISEVYNTIIDKIIAVHELPSE